MPQVQKEEVRQRLVDAATDAFFINGFENSSLRKICKDAQVTTGNLYRYFDNKEALYLAVVEDAYQELNTILKQVSQSTISLSEVPTREVHSKIPEASAGHIISGVIASMLKAFGEEPKGFLILLRDSNNNMSLTAQYSLKKWLQAHFELIYDELEIGSYLAHSFMEGLIHIAISEDPEKEKKLLEFVHFFFMRRL